MAKRNTVHDVWKHIDMSGGEDACWPWLLVPGGGKGRSRARPYFSLDGKKVIATRLVFVLYYGEPLEPDDKVLHTCDNSICCNPKHLYKGTHADNTEDMVSRDRHGLPSHVVRRIRVLLARGRTHQEIADLYGIERTIVTKINNDKVHTHANDYPSSEDFAAEDDVP